MQTPASSSRFATLPHWNVLDRSGLLVTTLAQLREVVGDVDAFLTADPTATAMPLALATELEAAGHRLPPPASG